MDIVQLTVSIMVALGTFAGIIKWGISSYIKKVQELQEIKDNHIEERLDQLEEAFRGLQCHLRETNKELSKITKTLEKFDFVELKKDIYAFRKREPMI